MNQETKRPITLEDILRLKRAERPPAEFWATFDRELRAKQLAALVEKRPWWRTVPRALAGVTRYHLPLGAMAILVVTFVATRDYRAPSARIPRTISVPKVAAQVTPAGSMAFASERPATVSEAAELAAASTLSDESAAGSPETLSTETTIASNDAPPSASRDTPSARYIAENLKAAQAAEPAIARSLLRHAHGFETHLLPVRVAAIEPLAQMTTPAAARSAKLNSAMALSFSTENSTRTSERVANRLSDDRLYDEVPRFGAKANRFSMKF